MRQGTFFCIDAHTCGNPVRLVAGGVPPLKGNTMSEKRQYFLEHYDWIRQALMFEPRGHSMMSGSVVLPPCSDNAAIENRLITPKEEGRLILDVPAGQIEVHYQTKGDKVTSVKIFNVPAYLAHQDVTVEVEGLGEITVDVSYGGNYYVIVDPQTNYAGLEHYSPDEILMLSPRVREAVSKAVECVHPDDPTVCGVSHVLWTGSPTHENATARNAVFYGDKALDRSPCGTGTSARMAQWHAKGKLKQGEDFVHESIIGSLFNGRIEGVTEVNGRAAILPSIEGWAQVYGHNTIWVDDEDPYAYGFEVK